VDVACSARRLAVGKAGLAALCVLFMLGFWARPLLSALRHPAREFSPRDVAGVLVAIRQDVDANLHRKPRITARTNYLAFLADVANFPLPYTDYPGLVRYCELNNIDYVFLEDARLSAFPFLANFRRGDTPGFERIYAGNDSRSVPVGLYRLKRVPETTTKAAGAPG
jgi:hypothetical protein